MARFKYNLLELDINKLFEDHKIEEIIEIQKLLDAEIERKRIELRSTVGDRYKDILTASDAIRSMKTMSEQIVESIESIKDVCKILVDSTNVPMKITPDSVDRKKYEERALVIQIRLAIFINEQIWISLDKRNNLNAAQFYLLAQTIHTGLSLINSETLHRIPLLKQLRENLQLLKEKIFSRIKEDLESVEITSEQTCSNLNGYLLLQNQSTEELFGIFISHRRTALNTLLNAPHSSVRIQFTAMVKCLITTIHLLYDCFIGSSASDSGLIWNQLDDIVNDSAPTTLEKLELPSTPLNSYIPDVIKRFRPSCKIVPKIIDQNIKEAIEQWLKDTHETIKEGLRKSLELVTNIKGLYIIREEVLKIDLPKNWEEICTSLNLPENFSVWYYFFQNLITERTCTLLSKKLTSISSTMENNIIVTLEKCTLSSVNEADLRSYIWNESDDIVRTENKQDALSMKTKGYSPSVVALCEELDKQYLGILADIFQYLYGVDLDNNLSISFTLRTSKLDRKYLDRTEIERHLIRECLCNTERVIKFAENWLNEQPYKMHLVGCLMCARFSQAVTFLCPHFSRCCSINSLTDNWHKICDLFNKFSIDCWEHWMSKCTKITEIVAKEQLECTLITHSMHSLAKWDTIEIQEQADDKIFKSYIKVPFKPSLALQNILSKINRDLSYVLPHTLPKTIHEQFIQKNVGAILIHYSMLSTRDINQNLALQFLFDVKFMKTMSISRENARLISFSQEVCDDLRAKIDPFDLDVFYSYLQTNVKRAVIQSQVLMGCLLPSPLQTANLGLSEKAKDQDRDPSILIVSVPTTSAWFPLLPITAPSQKSTGTIVHHNQEVKESKRITKSPKRSQDSASSVRSSAVALFGGLTTDWFS